MKSSRIEYLDNIKGFAIICVIIGHFSEHMNDGEWLHSLIYMFHLPLFFMVSGFLSTSLEMKDIKSVIQSKAVSLLLPYLSFAFISTLVRGIDRFPKYWMAAGKGGLWFLPALFIFFVVLTCILKLNKSKYNQALFIPLLGEAVRKL